MYEKQQSSLGSVNNMMLENDISVTADRVTYYSDTRTIVAKGNVLIYKKDAFVSKADEETVNSEFSIFKIKGHTTTKIYQSEQSNSNSTQQSMF